MKLSVVILTKNNSKIIKRCIESVNNIANQLIVIDDYSNDSTVKISESLGATVYKRKLNNNWANQRNYGLSKAEGDWVLFVDSDELVDEKLAAEIKTGLGKKGENGYFLKRTDFIWNHKMKGGEFAEKKLLRLAKKGKGKWKRKVHEYWNIKGKIGHLQGSLLHYSHNNLKDFLISINKMSTVHANENISEGKNPTLLKIVFYPLLKIFKNYIIDQGYKDKDKGFVADMMMSMHSFLSWSKAWLIKNQKS